jgi:hypothetical protein
MTSKARNWLLAIFIVLFPFTLFCLFLFTGLVEGPLPPLAPVPNPNGYGDLVKAGQTLISINQAEPDGGYGTTNRTKLQILVSTNAEALSLARAGLSNKCGVTVQFSPAYVDTQNDELAGLKKLGLTFAAEGKLKEMDNRPNDAAKSYLDTIHLGIECGRGGVLIDELVGIAIEAIGTRHLQALLPHLDANTCRETSSALEALDAQRQTWDEVMLQERAWSQRTFRGWRYTLMRLETGKSLDAAFAKSRNHVYAQEQKTRQLIIALAARAYELEKGKPPAGTADLVPEYLKAVPQDPVTGTNMIYSPR